MLVTAPTTHWFRTSRNSYMPESEPMSYKKHACFEPTFFKKCLAQKCFWVQVGARPWSFFFRVKQFIATPLQKRSNPLDSKRALPPGLLEPKVRHLQSQPALSAHQPQAADLQPHARGAAGQRGRTHCGRPAGVPEARVGWQLGLQRQSPPLDCRTAGSSRARTASGGSLAQKTRSETAARRSTSSSSARALARRVVGREADRGPLPLGVRRRLPRHLQSGRAEPNQRLQAQELASLGVGA